MSSKSLTPVNNWLDIPGMKVTPVSVTFPENLTYDQWAGLGPRIGKAKRFYTWMLAEWLNFGERRYGEMYAQAVDTTGVDPGYLAVIKSVGASVAPCRRREGLSFNHHRVVAPLEPEEQERFLAEAEEHGWDRDQLAEAVREFRLLLQPEKKRDYQEPPDQGVVSVDSEHEQPEDGLLLLHCVRELGNLGLQLNNLRNDVPINASDGVIRLWVMKHFKELESIRCRSKAIVLLLHFDDAAWGESFVLSFLVDWFGEASNFESRMDALRVAVDRFRDRSFKKSAMQDQNIASRVSHERAE